MAKMVTLSINGKNVTVPEGTSVFQAASEMGIFVPHYCYHPDLSVAGVCRMCMVEIEKNPRPQISCNTIAADGMVVRTDTQKIKDTVKGVLELHLINHPLDCPICDKAGECKLQDFYQSFGLYTSRMEHEKVHKPKVQDIGTIMLDSERCILCTRCVRFTHEVTKTDELGIFNRGDRSTLSTFDGGALKNDYTGNLADICPVGALTAKDFRFQMRVWFLEKTETICTMCARGCNTTVSFNPQLKKLYRVEPRRNVDVNKSWICDTGRWGFHAVTSGRIETPLELLDGKHVETTWHESFKKMNVLLTNSNAKPLFLLSTALTNEEIIDAVHSFSNSSSKFDAKFAWLVDEAVVMDEAPYDGVLKHRDTTPNARGFQMAMNLLGKNFLKLADLSEKLNSTVVFVLGLEGIQLNAWAEVAKKIPQGVPVFVHATNHHVTFEKVSGILPNTSGFEKSGTMVNALGRLQKLKQALPPQGLSRTGHEVVWGMCQGHDRGALPEGTKKLFDSHVRPNTKCESWDRFPSLGVQINAGS